MEVLVFQLPENEIFLHGILLNNSQLNNTYIGIRAVAIIAIKTRTSL